MFWLTGVKVYEICEISKLNLLRFLENKSGKTNARQNIVFFLMKKIQSRLFYKINSMVWLSTVYFELIWTYKWGDQGL